MQILVEAALMKSTAGCVLLCRICYFPDEFTKHFLLFLHIVFSLLLFTFPV